MSPHHEQRGGGAGGEVLAEDVAETGRLDGGGERAAHAGQDQDLSALLEAGGDRMLNRLGPQRVAADEARADQADQQRDDGGGDELDDRVVDVGGVEDRAGRDEEQARPASARRARSAVSGHGSRVAVLVATPPPDGAFVVGCPLWRRWFRHPRRRFGSGSSPRNSCSSRSGFHQP